MSTLCAVLGGPSPGLHKNIPWIVAGKNAAPFPVAILCRSVDEAKQVMELQPMVETTMKEEPPLSPTDLVQRFFHSDKVSATLNDGETTFWAVLLGYCIAIYRSWEHVEASISGSRFQSVKKFNTFCGALICMISHGTALNGDREPIPLTNKYDFPGSNLGSPFNHVPSKLPPHTPLSVPAPTTPRSKLKNKSVPNTQATLEAKNTPFKDSHTFTGTPSHGRYTYRAVNAIHGAKSPRPITPESEASFVPYSSLAQAQGSGHSESSSAPARLHIYQHIRVLAGIVDTLTQPDQGPTDDKDDAPPSLGAVVDSYLVAHGYKVGSIFHIFSAYMDANTVEAFVAALCPKGMPQREVEWIWDHVELS